MIEPTDIHAPSPSTVPAIAVSALLVVAAWAVLQFWSLGKAPFHTKGEPREGLVVWEMTHGGGWILPQRNGIELPSKPPLFHWLGAVTSLLHGATDEWSIRFPSAALSLLGLLCVFAAGAALWSAQAGLGAALALMTTFEWARAATNARVDMTLTFGLELAFLSLLFFLRSRAGRWLIPLYVGIALAVLGKGPVGVILPGLVALLMMALGRDAGVLRQMRLGAGAIVVAVVAGSWYVMALWLGGWGFFRKQVLAENIFTFLDNPDYGSGGHRHSVAYVLGTLLLGVLPWTIFLPGVVARCWRQRRDISRNDARVYLLVWIVVVFAFYAVAASKRSVYLLALYPAVALLLGWWWDEQSRAAEDNWLAALLQGVVWPLLGVVATVFVVVLLEGLGAPVLASMQRWLPPAAQPFVPVVSDTIRAGRWPLLGCLLLAGASLYAGIRAARTLRWRSIFVSVFVAVAAVLLSTSRVILPGIAERQCVRDFMSEVRNVIGPSGTLFFYKMFEYEAVFYWEGHIPVYDGPWPAGAPRYLLMQQATWEQAQTVARDQYQEVVLPNDRSLNGPERLVLVRRVEAQ